jgi:hypothetical protein
MVVSASDVYRADVLVEDGRVALIGSDLRDASMQSTST